VKLELGSNRKGSGRRIDPWTVLSLAVLSSRLVLRSWWWYEGWTNHSACLKGPGGHWCCWCHMQRQCCCWIELLFHEIGAITNLLNYLTTNQSMNAISNMRCTPLVVSQSTRISRS